MIPPGYTVTREGRIKGPRGKWLSPDTSNGVARITVSVNGVCSNASVATLVCEAFHGPAPSPGHVPVHIDGDSLNNRAENLRWGTKGEERRARGTHELPAIQGELHPNAVLTWDKVRSIRQEYAAGNTTQRKLAAKYGVSGPTIHAILHNTLWHDPGYTPPPPRH